MEKRNSELLKFGNGSTGPVSNRSQEMTNLPKSLIEKLEEEFVVNPLKQRIVQESKDGTIKYLFELPDGMLIETVLMNQPTMDFQSV